MPHLSSDGLLLPQKRFDNRRHRKGDIPDVGAFALILSKLQCSPFEIRKARDAWLKVAGDKNPTTHPLESPVAGSALYAAMPPGGGEDRISPPTPEHNTDPIKAYKPTAADIEREAAKIRAKWSIKVARRRSGATRWTVPTVSIFDSPDD